VKKAPCSAENRKHLYDFVDIQQKLQQCGYKVVHSLSIDDVLDEVTRPLSEFKVISNCQFEHLSVIRLTYLLFRIAEFTFRLLYAQPRHNPSPVLVDLFS